MFIQWSSPGVKQSLTMYTYTFVYGKRGVISGKLMSLAKEPVLTLKGTV